MTGSDIGSGGGKDCVDPAALRGVEPAAPVCEAELKGRVTFTHCVPILDKGLLAALGHKVLALRWGTISPDTWQIKIKDRGMRLWPNR